MDPHIPPILHPLLQDYSDWAKQAMAGQVTALYLEGSIALGEFNPRLSDIDFVAVVDDKAMSGNAKSIPRIHKRLEQKFPWKMSGMYFQSRDLGCLDQTIEPFLNYHEGKLKQADRFELSSVTWWILKNHGIAVFGPPLQSSNINVDLDQMIRVQHKNLNTYWASWTTRPRRIFALLSDWGVQWTVLGVLRQYYTIHERRITSKIKAGEYALTRLPGPWHPIIREAICLRQNPNLTRSPSRIKRAYDASHFIRYIIRVCNDFLST